MTDRDDQGDPLLVRPYLQGGPGAPAPQSSTQTWPEAAAVPVAGPAGASDATVPIVLPAAAARAPRRHRLPLVLAAVLVLVVAGVAALVAGLWPDARTTRALPTDIPLPSIVVSEPVPATADPLPAAPPATGAATRTRAATDGPTAAIAPYPEVAPASSAPAPAPATSPAPDRLKPPAVDRIGRIRGTGGLCLDLPAAAAVDDSRIQVFTCNDTSAQVWTTAADGTLRVAGKCAVAADDGSVRVAGCDGRQAAQWRAGPDHTVVTAATGACLTDPSAGARPATAVRVEKCTGETNQTWKLP